jgi:hypothetical protein
MTVTLGVLALLEAKLNEGADLAAFLESSRTIAAGEDGTVTWYAFKVDDTTYGIFDTFESQDGLDAAPRRGNPQMAVLTLDRNARSQQH